MKPPTAESFWVTPRVLAGKYPGAKTPDAAKPKIAALIDAGVRTFVDLTVEGELVPYARLLPAGIAHHRIPITDVTAPHPDQVREALRAIEQASPDGVVYVHCWGGCGRTGVIVGCYLVEHGYQPDAALARVYELTRTLQTKPCPETAAQRAVVQHWSPAVSEEEWAGDEAARPRSTAALHSSDVPDPDGTLEYNARTHQYPPMLQFARSYSLPPGVDEELWWFVTLAALKHWKERQELPYVNIAGLRMVLAGMHLIWRHTAHLKEGLPEYAAEEAFIRALVEEIRLQLWQEEQWWWDPGHTPTDEERRERALQRSTEHAEVSLIYRLASDLVNDVIRQRDDGDEDPLNLPLFEYEPVDPVQSARKHLAYLVMRGLAALDPSASLEELQTALLDRAPDASG